MITRSQSKAVKFTPISNHHNKFDLKNKKRSVIVNDICRSSTSATTKSKQNSNSVTECSVVLCDVLNSKINNVDKNRKKESGDGFNLPDCKVVLSDFLKDKTNNANETMELGNGRDKRIFKCNSKKCGLNPNFLARDKAVSSCTCRVYDCITPPGTIYVNCHSRNVIYLLTCSTCGLQYVGETSQKLNERFSGHRSGIRNPQKYGTCKILSQHFNKGLCKDSTYNVQILEKLEASGRTSRNAVDLSVAAACRKR